MNYAFRIIELVLSRKTGLPFSQLHPRSNDISFPPANFSYWGTGSSPRIPNLDTMEYRTSCHTKSINSAATTKGE